MSSNCSEEGNAAEKAVMGPCASPSPPELMGHALVNHTGCGKLLFKNGPQSWKGLSRWWTSGTQPPPQQKLFQIASDTEREVIYHRQQGACPAHRLPKEEKAAARAQSQAITDVKI